jgi:hypothetical protein
MRNLQYNLLALASYLRTVCQYHFKRKTFIQNNRLRIVLQYDEMLNDSEPRSVLAKTLSVEEVPTFVEKLTEFIPYSVERPPTMLDNDADTDASIFTNEMPLQLEPESMSEVEQTEPVGVRGDDEGPSKMPGSFDMSTAHPQKQMSWMEKNMGL